ncbi:MAG TPA: hypothetical protein VJN18_35865 [Polyangiaceae bacterium]|nr:hypothetical protein [Polyangiaceae bacterium]
MADKTKSALTGAGTGAATGAAIGSVVPGIGTAVGAVGGALIGGIGGWLGADDEQAPTYNPTRANFQYGLGDSGTYASTQSNRYDYQQGQLRGMADHSYNRDAPTQAMPDRVDFVQSQGQGYLNNAGADARAQQLQALGGYQNANAALQGFANRAQGPSAAQAQLRAGTDAAARQQYGFARSQPGGGGAALRNAAFNAAGLQGQAANSAAMLRAQEDQAYRAQQLQALGAVQSGAAGYANQFGALRGQDIGLGQLQAGQANYSAGAQNQFNQQQQQLQFGVGQNNLNSQLQSTRQNDAMYLGLQGQAMGYEGLRNQLAAGQQSATQAYESARAAGAGLGAQNFNAATQQGNTETAMALGALQGGATAVATMNQPQGQVSASPSGGTTVSDVRAKTDIKPVSAGSYFQQLGDRNREHVQGEVDRAQYLRALSGGDPSLTSTAEFAPSARTADLRPAQAAEFRYRNPEQHGQGQYMGGMAQQLEHIPGVVQEQPDGTKAVDGGRLAMAVAPAVGEQQRRIDELEMQLRALGGGQGMVPALRSSPVYAQPQGTGGL